MEEWTPIGEDEFVELYVEEREQLSTVARAVLTRFAIHPRRMPIERLGLREEIWVVAQAGERVLFYDDVEEEFGTGSTARDGVIRDWGTWGERLAWALRAFARGLGEARMNADGGPVARPRAL